MSNEIMGYSVNHLFVDCIRDGNVERSLDVLGIGTKGKVLYKHKDIKLLGRDMSGLMMGILDSPEILSQLSILGGTPSSCRTTSLDVEDNFGSAKYVIKGANTSNIPFLGSDVSANEHHIRKIRFNKRNIDELGKHGVTSSSAEIGTLNEINRYNPGTFIDFNGSFWIPLIVVESGKNVVGLDDYQKDHVIERGVVDIRRFPFTIWRLEDVLNFNSTLENAKEEVNRLRGLWNFDSNTQVYLRSIGRWANANRQLITAQVRHVQVFDFYTDNSSGLTYAWINPNNIGLDGGTGDLDCSRKYVDYWADQKRGRVEAVGGYLMYLAMTYILSPEIFEDDTFLRKSIDIFQQHIGRNNFQDMLNNQDFDYTSKIIKNSILLYSAGVSLFPDQTKVSELAAFRITLPSMLKICERLTEMLSN